MPMATQSSWLPCVIVYIGRGTWAGVWSVSPGVIHPENQKRQSGPDAPDPLPTPPSGVNLVRSIWLFKHKFHADGTLIRYKACLVANGSSQQLGVDFDDTFSLVVKLATIRTVLSLVVSRKWPIHQLDVKNDFLNGDLSETLYMHQPPGYATRVGLYHSRCDSSLFIYRQGSQVTYLLIYVVDIILTSSSSALLQQIFDPLHSEFDMTGL
ncbi:ribonuclease H-like domain-containing protein [Tanacetum coccineum]